MITSLVDRFRLFAKGEKIKTIMRRRVQLAMITLMLFSLTGCTSDSEVPKSVPVKPVASDSPARVREVKRIPIKLSTTPLTKSFRGISLGMTLVQLKKIHPKIDADDLIVDSDFCDCAHRFDQPNDCPHVYGCGEGPCSS